MCGEANLGSLATAIAEHSPSYSAMYISVYVLTNCSRHSANRLLTLKESPNNVTTLHQMAFRLQRIKNNLTYVTSHGQVVRKVHAHWRLNFNHLVKSTLTIVFKCSLKP